jgi:hypothetical protein
MKNFKTQRIYVAFIMLTLSVLLITGCGNGKDALLYVDAQSGSVTPGTCTEVGPAVISSNPTDSDVNVTTSTVGHTGKLITVNFSEPMKPDTVTTSLTFTLRKKSNGVRVDGVTTMDTLTTATFTTNAALDTDTVYTATITKAAENALGTPLGCSYKWSFTTGASAAAGQAPVNLGTASAYGIFASADASVTLTGPSVLVEGNVGLMDGAGTCIGCSVSTVTGAIHNGDLAAAQAQSDLNAAYVEASTRSTSRCTLAAPTDLAAPQGACTGYTDPPGSIGPTTFNTYLPGLYWSAGVVQIGVGKTIVLDAQGDASAVFIFQASSAITTGDTSVVMLVNNAQAKNVFWVANSAATLGVSSIFKGTAIANTGAITVNNGTSGSPTLVAGRLFSHGAAASMGHDATITVPAP